MTHSLKRSIIKRLLCSLGLSKYFLKTYPVAVENEFSRVSRDQIDHLRFLFPLKISNDVSWRRFGSPGDGGYLLNDDLSESDICISLGIGDNFSFDLEIAKNCGLVLMFDHTISQPQTLLPNMVFKKVGVSAVEIGNFTTIERIIEHLPAESDLILKIDIEGTEWEILQSLTLDTLGRFRQIVAEFHNLHAIHNTKLFEKIIESLSKLSQTHFLANFHINNWASYQLVAGVPFPDVVEVTYIRRVTEKGESFNLENLMNQSNNNDLPDAAPNFICAIEI